MILINAANLKMHRMASSLRAEPMACPSDKWFVNCDLSSLQEPIRPPGVAHWAKMAVRARSFERRQPRGSFCAKGFLNTGRLLGHLAVVPPAGRMGSIGGPPTGVTRLLVGAAAASKLRP